MPSRRTSSTLRSPDCGPRACRMERLEARLPLTGEVFLVNFQLDEATPPTRYAVDHGLPFGDRGNGLVYGWSSDHTDQARERSLAADQRFDTLIHIEAGQSWEFALPNGVYEVTVAVGDPANNDGRHTINVEGVNFWNAQPDGNGPLVQTRVVSVADGRLTVDQGTAAHKATRINFVHAVGLPSGPSQPPAAPVIREPEQDGQLVSPNDVHMEADAFFDPDGQAHQSTDWEIWTFGGNPEPVWQTLGIQSIEKLHTHLGDGMFINGLAGRTALEPNAPYQLRVRFRDASGAVSPYATRNFDTDAASAVLPLALKGVAAAPAPLWVDVAGAAVELPAEPTLLAPGSAIRAIDLDGDSSYPSQESPARAVDGTPAKYLNFGKLNSGFIVTPAAGPSIVTGFRITTANDAPERDPSQWQLYGSNSVVRSGDNSRGDGEDWTLVAAGTLSLPATRNAVGPLISLANAAAYASYRMVFTAVKNAATANALHFGEIQFYGTAAAGGLQPATLRLADATATGNLLAFAGQHAAGNSLVVGAPLPAASATRIVLEAGSQPLVAPNSQLSFTDVQGIARAVYLPALDLAAWQRLDLWAAADGSVYFGDPDDDAPDFTRIARSAPLAVPFVAARSGFVVEQVGRDYRLPVNIAFVPDPGPEPHDPLYFVTELYGSIQAVARDGSRHPFATGLLDYNPLGPISGSGEQGLTGIAVERDAVQRDVYRLYVTMLWDNGAPPGNAVHYPKVERLDSAPGGLSMASRTVLLNMRPETQGQSHQISHVSIGPDEKLYVHNGDGFDASTALNLNSFRGKVLRLNKDGTAPADNPFYNAADGISARDYVFAYGLRNPFGGAWRQSDRRHYAVENGPSVDRLARIDRGASYGWNGSNSSMYVNALYAWNPARAPVNIAFVEQAVFAGSRFPANLLGRAFVSESGPTYASGRQTLGKRIVEFAIDADGRLAGEPATLVEYVGTGKSTIAGLAAGPDGLYFTELYEETGAQGATAAGARIFRVRYADRALGDHNVDRRVDGADLLAWQRAFDSNLLLGPDNNRDGRVTEADLPAWEAAFGSAEGALAAAATAPPSGEPLPSLPLAPRPPAPTAPPQLTAPLDPWLPVAFRSAPRGGLAPAPRPQAEGPSPPRRSDELPSHLPPEAGADRRVPPDTAYGGLIGNAAKASPDDDALGTTRPRGTALRLRPPSPSVGPS